MYFKKSIDIFVKMLYNDDIVDFINNGENYANDF